MIREFWREVKEEKKERKRLKKEMKKRALTREQKVTKVFGVLFGFFVLFGSLFFACNNMSFGDLSGLNWGMIVGLDEETIEELELPVDENLLLIDGKLTKDDYLSFIDAWILAGAEADCFDEEGNLIESETDDSEEQEEESELIYIDTPLVISGRELGGWCKETNSDVGNVANFDILDMKIYEQNGTYYLSTIVLCKLGNVLGIEDVPNVYLKTVSPVQVLGGDLTVLGSDLYINQLSEEANTKVVNKLNEASDNKLSTLVNDLVVSLYINPLKQILNATIQLSDNGIVFIPVEV
ncbi:MAG: hypothetical protein E7354_02715 [Clostridiales bacterium]|nr:hypothetical protein [Clostridiales bacterium]